jgi:hypothetical protein
MRTGFFIALVMETVTASETTVNFCKTPYHNITEYIGRLQDM